MAHDQHCGPGQQSQFELRFRHGTIGSLTSLSDFNFLPADSIMVSIRNDVSLTFGRRCYCVGTNSASLGA